jgi:hypothetical protein
LHFFISAKLIKKSEKTISQVFLLTLPASKRARMNKIFYCLILLVLLVTGCNGKKEMGNTAAMDTIPDMIMQIQECSRLYTAEVHVHKIVTHQDEKTLKGNSSGRTYPGISPPQSER